MLRKSLVFVVMAILFGPAISPVHAQTWQYFQFPVYGYGNSVSQNFDVYGAVVTGKYHTGMDIVASGPQYIIASAFGQIYKIQPNAKPDDHKEGNSIIILHIVPIDSRGRTMAVFTQYCHLANFASGLYVGKNVSAGTLLGTMGGTGDGVSNYWPRHLHFEVKTDGVLNNPSGTGQYWGYTPDHAYKYGFIDPASVINKWWAIR